MIEDDGRDIIIVSDLHLGAGYDAQSGTFDQGESCSHDVAFAHFLESLIERAAQEGRNWRLLFLGDFCDFLRVKTGPADTPTATALLKLERIVAGHAELFAAVGGFLDAGFPVDVVPGNHDIDLIRLPVQDRLRELIARLATKPGATDNLRFHPWIYYVPNVLYAEHGSQYHDINWFETILNPFEPSKPDTIAPPLVEQYGLFVHYLVKARDPTEGDAKAPFRCLLRRFRRDPVLELKTLPHYLRFGALLVRRVIGLPEHQRCTRRALYREVTLRRFAAEIGLDHATVLAIDRLAETAAASIWRRILTNFGIGLLRMLPPVVALLGMWAVARRTHSIPYSAALWLASGIGLVGASRKSRTSARSSKYMRAAAATIDQLLRKENNQVPFYIFGHTHIAEEASLTSDTDAPKYLNPGTWTATVSSKYRSTGRLERFSFVQLTRDPGSGGLMARLMYWKDAARQVVPIP